MRVTLLEIFFFVTVCCLLAGGAMQGNPYESTPYVATLANVSVSVLVCCLLICAFVLTERRRAFAIGFVIAAGLYGLPLFWRGAEEFDINMKPQHFFSNPIRALYSRLSREVVIDMETGEEIENYPSITLQERSKLMTLFIRVPNSANFLYFSHVFIAVLVGYAGANFGRLACWWDTKSRITKE